MLERISDEIVLRLQSQLRNCKIYNWVLLGYQLKIDVCIGYDLNRKEIDVHIIYPLRAGDKFIEEEVEQILEQFCSLVSDKFIL